MLKIIAIIAVVLAVGIAGILAFAATKPDTFRVERTLAIKAPAEAIYPLIADFHRWTSWSPYESRDPDMKRTYGGSEQGKGAIYGWDGNNKIGSGRMEILEAAPPSKIRIKLDFARPFEAHNIAEFTMQPQGQATNVTTNVTWTMYGPAPFMAKIMHVFINMDKMVGTDFEAGLVNLKKLTEK